jgi:hypothetical protein
MRPLKACGFECWQAPSSGCGDTAKGPKEHARRSSARPLQASWAAKFRQARARLAMAWGGVEAGLCRIGIGNGRASRPLRVRAERANEERKKIR